MQAARGARRKHDDALPVPGGAQAGRPIGQNRDGPSGREVFIVDVDSLQLPARKESDRTTVRRPERPTHPFGPRHGQERRVVEPAKVQLRLAIAGDWQHHQAAIGRHHRNGIAGEGQMGRQRDIHTRHWPGRGSRPQVHAPRQDGGDDGHAGQARPHPLACPAARVTGARRRAAIRIRPRLLLLDPLELRPHVVHGLPAIGGILRQAHLHDVIERGRHHGRQRREPRRLRLEDLRHRATRSFSLQTPSCP